MQKLFLSTLLALTVLLSNTPSVSAWDDVGHKITGYIAWQRMSPAARENVIRVLRAAPEDSDISTFFLQFGPMSRDEKRLEYFTFVPTWADVVRDRDFPVRQGKYHKSTWHYSDTFWRPGDGKPEIITDSKPGGQGVNKLIDFDKAMRDPSVSDADKAIAIAWFLHIGGDLHQPLHTSGRHTDREPKGDQGGNFFLLTPEGTEREDQLNLHWYWDAIVGRNIPYRTGMCEGDYIRNVAESMMLRYPFASEKSRLNLAKYAEWQKESFAVAVSEVFRPDLVRFEMPTDAYRRNAYNVAEQRLALAGYRLGETLNAIFGGSGDAAESAQASCQVIRKIMYPIFKLQTPENIAKTKPTLAVLNTCPTGPAARPTIEIEVAGVRTHRVFDIVKVFSSEAEARDYAATNSITDISFEIQ